MCCGLSNPFLTLAAATYTELAVPCFAPLAALCRASGLDDLKPPGESELGSIVLSESPFL
jgi:hypothetical protein